MQKPHKGPFYVSHKTIDQLIANLGRWARFILDTHLNLYNRHIPFPLTLFNQGNGGGEREHLDLETPQWAIFCIVQNYWPTYCISRVMIQVHTWWTLTLIQPTYSIVADLTQPPPPGGVWGGGGGGGGGRDATNSNLQSYFLYTHILKFSVCFCL